MEATAVDTTRPSRMLQVLAWAVFGLTALEIVVGAVLTGVKLAAGSLSGTDASARCRSCPRASRSRPWA